MKAIGVFLTRQRRYSRRAGVMIVIAIALLEGGLGLFTIFTDVSWWLPVMIGYWVYLGLIPLCWSISSAQKSLISIAEGGFSCTYAMLLSVGPILLFMACVLYLMCFDAFILIMALWPLIMFVLIIYWIIKFIRFCCR